MAREIEVHVQEVGGARYSYPAQGSVQSLKAAWLAKHSAAPDTFLEVAIVSGKSCHVAQMQWMAPFFRPAYKPVASPAWKRMSHEQYLGV